MLPRPGEARVDVSIRAPHARGDRCRRLRVVRLDVSIRAPHARGDGAQGASYGEGGVSIRAPHARGDRRGADLDFLHEVSIRAPHARGDTLDALKRARNLCFNPRPSCEGRPEILGTVKEALKFQSAPLMRGATR